MRPAPAAFAAVLLLAACGNDEPDLDGTWDVTLVVGDAVADPAADDSAFPGVGSDAAETWTFACDSSSCALGREPGGFLGDLDGVPLVRDGDSLRAEVGGVQPEEPSPCTGTPAETWTVTIDLAVDADSFVGSAFRIPDALVDGDCFGLDLTLGVSGARRP